jgi:hypothetical protein
MEDTPEVYHYSIAEAAELLGCKESHLLQLAAFEDLPLSVFVADTLVDKDGNHKGSFSKHFRLARTHVRALIANGSAKLDVIELMTAAPVPSGTGKNYADATLWEEPLDEKSWTYRLLPQSREIYLAKDRVLILAEHFPLFQKKINGEGVQKQSPIPASIQAEPAHAATPLDAEMEPRVAWKKILYERIREIDTAHRGKAKVQQVIRWLKTNGGDRVKNEGNIDELIWVDDLGNRQTVGKKTISNELTNARSSRLSSRLPD